MGVTIYDAIIERMNEEEVRSLAKKYLKLVAEDMAEFIRNSYFVFNCSCRDERMLAGVMNEKIDKFNERKKGLEKLGIWNNGYLFYFKKVCSGEVIDYDGLTKLIDGEV